MKSYTLEELKNELMTDKERSKYEKELKEEMSLKKGMKVLFHNRGTWEQGTIQRKWRRKEVLYFNIETERGSIIEGITLDQNYPCWVDENKSLKLNQKLNPNANTEL